jgi:Domain of unknown function (DUF5658)
MPRAPLGSHRQAHVLLAGVIALLACTWPHPASAQQAALEAPAHVNASLAALLTSSQPFVRSAPPRVGTIEPLHAERLAADSPSRPAALPALYISFAVLQGLDAHSTLTAVSAGGREVNPAVRDLVTQPASFVGAKIAATAGTLYLAERLWKKKHRTAAVVLMVAINTAYGVIVAHNYRGRP